MSFSRWLGRRLMPSKECSKIGAKFKYGFMTGIMHAQYIKFLDDAYGNIVIHYVPFKLPLTPTEYKAESVLLNMQDYLNYLE